MADRGLQTRQLEPLTTLRISCKRPERTYVPQLSIGELPRAEAAPPAFIGCMRGLGGAIEQRFLQGHEAPFPSFQSPDFAKANSRVESHGLGVRRPQIYSTRQPRERPVPRHARRVGVERPA